MPLYEYRCAQCGAFEHRRDTEHANAPLLCPACSAPARRIYTAPHTRTGPLARADAADRARIGRALTGEPVITPAPQGRPLPTRSHRH